VNDFKFRVRTNQIIPQSDERLSSDELLRLVDLIEAKQKEHLQLEIKTLGLDVVNNLQLEDIGDYNKADKLDKVRSIEAKMMKFKALRELIANLRLHNTPQYKPIFQEMTRCYNHYFSLSIKHASKTMFINAIYEVYLSSSLNE
jgi:hypothetical protein